MEIFTEFDTENSDEALKTGLLKLSHGIFFWNEFLICFTPAIFTQSQDGICKYSEPGILKNIYGGFWLEKKQVVFDNWFTLNN